MGDRATRTTVVIEPQVADYWPQTPPLGNAEVLVLSRFAYLRRRGDAMVLESPRAGALFRICDPKIATALALLSTPQQVGRLRRQDGFPGIELLALLVDCQILFKVDAAHDGNLRPAEGDADLVLWDFHDLLFHARSTPGRHANPLGGAYPYAGVTPAPPAVRRRWPGKAIDLRPLSRAAADVSPTARLLHERHSVRSFDDERPITLAELARFLDSTARVVSTWQSQVDLGDARPVVAYATRPYPSAGASYELELYLAVDKCDGLARGFYHYDAGGHALVPIDVPHAATRSAVHRSAAFHGRARHAADRHHHRGALRPGVMEIQLARLCAHPEGRRRVDSDALPDGDRHGTWRVRDREHQYRSVREDDRDRIPRRGPGRSIRAWSRHATGGFRMRRSPTRTISGARRTHRGARRARNIRPGGFSAFPPARMRHPAGPRIG